MSSGLGENINFGNQQFICKVHAEDTQSSSGPHSLSFDSQGAIKLEKQQKEVPGVGEVPGWVEGSRQSVRIIQG